MKKTFITLFYFFLFYFTISYNVYSQKQDPESNILKLEPNSDIQPRSTDTLFVNGIGDDFDKLLRREEVPNGRATYKVKIDRFYSNRMEFNAEGLLTNSEELVDIQLLPKTALLTLRVFDVDDKGNSKFKPEVDYVFVNGKQVKYKSGGPFKLTSGNEKWSIKSVSIPIEFLKFPQTLGDSVTHPSAENLIEIDIDQNEQRWYVKCDWISIEIKSPIRPVVMIHGFLGTAKTWATFKSFFDASGIPNHVPRTGFMNNVGAIADNSFNIGVEIGRVINMFGVSKVNLLVHSKGGLDSRHYIRQSLFDDVESLIQLATPNNGTDRANFWNGYNPGFLMPASEQLTTTWLRDNFNYIPPGGRGNNTIGFKPRFSESGPNKPPIFILSGVKFREEKAGMSPPHDNLVPVRSTTLPWNSSNIYPNLPRINNGEFPFEHSEMHEEISVYTAVRNILRSFGLKKTVLNRNYEKLNTSEVFANISGTPLMQIIYSKADSFATNEQKIVVVNVDTSSTVNFSSASITGEFSFSIIDPSGAEIDSTSSYYSSIYDEFGKFAEYNIENPQSGNWQFVISAKSEGSFIKSRVSLITNKKITITTESIEYSSNQPILISSEFMDGEQPILGADINAEILKHDGSVDSIPLFDDGTNSDPVANDGTYTNNYQGTNIPGSIIVKAIGVKGNISRINKSHIYIAPNSAILNSNYSENSIDSDTDGLIDALAINVGVNINTPGNYQLSATLIHDADNEIAFSTFTSQGSAQLSAGSQEIQLLFDGKEIFNKGFNGPYLLSNVVLTDLNNYMQVDFDEQPYTTQVYSINQFERPILFLTGNNSENTNTLNGKLQGILVSFDVDILNEGFYEYNAELTDTNDNFITWTSWQRTISSNEVGVNTLSLYFNGKDINNKRFNGPYYVKNLSIYSDEFNSPNANLHVKRLLKTSNYNFADFRGKLIIVNVINTVTSAPIRNAELFLNGEENSNPFKVYSYGITNIDGQVYFGGIDEGNYNVYASKGSLISDTSYFPIFLDLTEVTINMTIANTPPVFNNLPDTLTVPTYGAIEINLWDFIIDDESSDTSLYFDFNSNPDVLTLVFNDESGLLKISAKDSTFTGNVVLTVRADDTFGGITEESIVINFPTITGIKEYQNILPKEYFLYQNYPNPFNPSTVIRYSLPFDSEVTLKIFDIIGREIKTLVNQTKKAGIYKVEFNSLNLSSGVYFYTIRAKAAKGVGFTNTKKFILMK